MSTSENVGMLFFGRVAIPAVILFLQGLIDTAFMILFIFIAKDEIDPTLFGGSVAGAITSGILAICAAISIGVCFVMFMAFCRDPGKSTNMQLQCRVGVMLSVVAVSMPSGVFGVVFFILYRMTRTGFAAAFLSLACVSLITTGFWLCCAGWFINYVCNRIKSPLSYDDDDDE